MAALRVTHSDTTGVGTSVGVTGSGLNVPPGDDKEKSPKLNVMESTLPFAQSLSLALVYMFGCISFFLLIRWSKKRAAEGGPSYDNAAAVFLTELCKWGFSIGAMWYREKKFLPISTIREGSWKVGVYYAVPSGIYALYNNLTYYNLTHFDPGTYQVVMQTRVLFTGILFTYILKKLLTRRKWFALVLLTLGVIAKNFSSGLELDSRVLFMLFQASLSAFAGVYNEFLLKEYSSMDVNEQNFFMYSWALIFNLGYGLYSNPSYYTSGQLFGNSNGLFWMIVLNGALIGIVTSLILKFINVIVKAFASACEVLLTAVIAAFLLGDPLTGRDFVACCVVMYSIFVYYGTGPILPGTNIVIAEPPTSNQK